MHFLKRETISDDNSLHTNQGLCFLKFAIRQKLFEMNTMLVWFIAGVPSLHPSLDACDSKYTDFADLFYFKILYCNQKKYLQVF